MAYETAPKYLLQDFDLNPETRVAHVKFLETKMYKTVEKYVTRDYVKTPIYSNWKTKTKTIQKTIKLTNETLEALKDNPDHLIASFAFEIVSNISETHLHPSWYCKQSLSSRMEKDVNASNLSFDGKIRQLYADIENLDIQIDGLKKKIVLDWKILSGLEKRTEKLKKKKKSREERRNKPLFIVLTLGFYSFLSSERQLNRLESKIDLLKKSVATSKKGIDDCNRTIETHRTKIASDEKQIESLGKQKTATERSIRDVYQKRMDAIEPLLTNASSLKEDEFIPLKRFAGIKYEKIIGCYVIRNVENKKCYCGQSKDVVKRITRQHFQGTKPNNIIFAEDYYASSDRENLFEVRVIRLETKDELDATEKALIEEYDSFNNGYNGTAGNN